MSSDSGFEESLRRLKPEKRLSQLVSRERSQLTFVDSLKGRYPKFLLDTTVYIDAAQNSLPAALDFVLPHAEQWHSTVAAAELTALAGRLDPRHPETPQAMRKLIDLVERQPAHRVINPDARAWREAGILAGTLARLQHYGKGEQRRIMNDALIFVSAAYQGCAVLTRNVADFDFLMQLAPFGSAIFYERE